MIVASSPYAKKGILWDAHRRHYGPHGDPLVLVAKGASRDFNKTLRQSTVDRALAKDRASASAEYLAEFRSDIETFINYEVVASCVGDHVERAPLTENQPFYAFTDPSGGSSDSFTLAIGHREGERVVIDAIRETAPPFSPEFVINDFATLIRSYGIARVVGDRYAGEFPREQFRKRGIYYAVASAPKSDLYRDLLPLLNSGRIVLPKSDHRASLASLPIMAEPDFSATHLSGFTNNKSIKSRWGFGAFISSLPALNSETIWSLTSPEISFETRSSPINASMFLLKRLNSSLRIFIVT